MPGEVMAQGTPEQLAGNDIENATGRIPAPHFKHLTAEMQVHRGPLPPPEMLDGYNKVEPGSALKIVNMAVREQRHRHVMNLLGQAYPYLGMILGAALATVLIVSAFTLFMHDKVVGGSVCLSVSAVSVIGWFIRSRLESSRSDAPATLLPKQSFSPNKIPTRKKRRR